MDLRLVSIQPAQGSQRRADLVFDPARTSGGAALSCSRENVKLVITGSS
jgi:hypothetical protein